MQDMSSVKPAVIQSKNWDIKTLYILVGTFLKNVS